MYLYGGGRFPVDTLPLHLNGTYVKDRVSCYYQCLPLLSGVVVLMAGVCIRLSESSILSSEIFRLLARKSVRLSLRCLSLILGNAS